MGRCIWIILLALALLLSCGTQKPATIKTQAKCSYNKAQLMAMDQQHFDQDMSGGWRPLAHQPGCELTAADLIRDYRQAHNNRSSILYWHEGQIRAVAGDYKQAIPLLEQTYKPENQDYIGWNYYVNATIAFLKKDKQALAAARGKLAKVQLKPGSGYPPLKNGFVEFHTTNGQIIKVRWPENLDVVDGLIRCFNKPYKIAYGSKDCRSVSR